MRRLFLFICFCLFFDAFVSGQSQICYNDQERVFVFGIRYFKEPVLVTERKSRRCVITEKDNLSESADQDDCFYTKMWSFQPDSYGILEGAAFIRNFLAPQLKDSLERKILLDQITPEGHRHRISINSELLGDQHTFNNLTYYDLLCKRFLVLLISEAVLEKHIQIDLDPLPVYQEPKYGLYTKCLIPLPIGDTTYLEHTSKNK